MNVVLANGVQQTINSSSDLWWAMNGAGQNFGIVTSVAVKVYDIEYPDWAIATLTFGGNNVEAVYEAANQHLSDLPADIINWSYWLNMPDVDSDSPIILFYIIQEGATAVDPIYTAPFHALSPLSTESQSGTYRDLAAWTGIPLDTPPCQKAGLANSRFPIYLPSYNISAQRSAYDAFAANVSADLPFASSIFMFEAYPQQGVRTVEAASTAFAFRDDNLLISPLLTYTPAGADLDDRAEELGNRLRDILYGGSGREELHVYVNYAYGDETPKNWYGYESWRQDRLRNLKRKYDPEGRFSFYGPVENGRQGTVEQHCHHQNTAAAFADKHRWYTVAFFFRSKPPPDREEVLRRISEVGEVRKAAGGGMLEAVLKMFADGERRVRPILG
ncbi:Uu.00g002720.m01.CDS01 [Anthostomella pinea]|uniref:Uu.00g002720.m01.CDS01 n=1 Tax=Anthostomella pinea TaxID=933095 RepID=A0AAI8VK85_9PEZI|nr:Uu.00g002720.m01.CDS01 [Anthostomella pinea]